MWKECSKCGKIKPLWMFYKNKGKEFSVRNECKECSAAYREENKEYQIQYRKEHQEYLKQYIKRNKEYYKQYYHQHKKQLKEYRKLYKEGNKEQLKEYNKLYKQNNKDKINAMEAKRRALKMNQTPELTNEEKHRIEILYKWAQELPGDFHVDHIVPLSKGGLHHPDNLQIIPAHENLSKQDKDPREYYGRHYDFMVNGILP